MLKNKVLEKINGSLYEINKIKNNIYKGKVFVVADNNKIKTYYKTKRGANGYINKNKDWSYYDEYYMELVYPNSNLEVIEILESEIKTVNDVMLWHKELLRYLGQPHMIDCLDYYFNMVTDAEVKAYIKQGMQDIREGKGLLYPDESLINKYAIEAQTTKEEVKESNTEKETIFKNEEVEIVSVNNTTRIYFTNKPDSETISSIKKLGFRFFKNDGLYWGIYTNKFNLDDTRDALNIVTDKKSESLEEPKEELKEEHEQQENVFYFGIDGEGKREEKHNLSFEELKKEFNARVKESAEDNQNEFEGCYNKTWIYVTYNNIKYRTCRLDLTGHENIYICLADAIKDVLIGLKNNTKDAAEYYFNSTDTKACINLIDNLVRFLNTQNIEEDTMQQNKGNIKLIKCTKQEQQENKNNYEIIEDLYNDYKALENRLQLVTSAKLKYKIQSQLNAKMQEIAKIIISDPILYALYEKEFNL